VPLAAPIAAGYVRSRWGASALDQLLAGSQTGCARSVTRACARWINAGIDIARAAADSIFRANSSLAPTNPINAPLTGGGEGK